MTARTLFCLLLVGGMLVAASSVSAAPSAAAHKCSRGYVHAVIGGDHKCLHSGQRCAKRYQAQYRAKGFVCRKGSDGQLGSGSL